MAKFTVYFKDKVLQTHVFEMGLIYLGRDETNDLVIDSLAVAPMHAVVIVKESSCFIKQINENYPLLINNKLNKQADLQDNDVITIGKHLIVYNKAKELIKPQNFSKYHEVHEFVEKSFVVKKESVANLQILEGEPQGQVLTLKKSMTRIGQHGKPFFAIARRKEGYYITSLQENVGLIINDQALSDKILKLKHADIIHMGNMRIQFFLE